MKRAEHSTETGQAALLLLSPHLHFVFKPGSTVAGCVLSAPSSQHMGTFKYGYIAAINRVAIMHKER